MVSGAVMEYLYHLSKIDNFRNVLNLPPIIGILAPRGELRSLGTKLNPPERV